MIGTDRTVTQVDLDELYNTLDPETRGARAGLLQESSATSSAASASEANLGYEYLNPALSTSSRLARELTRDTPLLERFLVDSSQLVTALAERRDDLAGLIGNLNDDDARARKPEGGARRVDRAAAALHAPRQHDLREPSVNARRDGPAGRGPKPVAKRLGPTSSRRLGPSPPTPSRPCATSSVTIAAPRSRNDLIDLLHRFPPLADIATATARRSFAPGGHEREDVGETRGAFPETVDALRGGSPRDRLRAAVHDRLLRLVRRLLDNRRRLRRARRHRARYVQHRSRRSATDSGIDDGSQFRRCPGAAEAPLPDGSNVFSGGGDRRRARLRRPTTQGASRREARSRRRRGGRRSAGVIAACRRWS